MINLFDGVKHFEPKLKQTLYLLIVLVGNLLREETCWSFKYRIRETAQHHSLSLCLEVFSKAIFSNFKSLFSLEFLCYNIKHNHFTKWSWASLSLVHLRFAELRNILLTIFLFSCLNDFKSGVIPILVLSFLNSRIIRSVAL